MSNFNQAKLQMEIHNTAHPPLVHRLGGGLVGRRFVKHDLVNRRFLVESQIFNHLLHMTWNHLLEMPCLGGGTVDARTNNGKVQAKEGKES